MNKKSRIAIHFIRVLTLIGFVVSARGQDVSIPDPGLDSAIREALQKPSGPLTEQDLLALTNLTAITRNISNLQGLEFALNLSLLNLDDNNITNFSGLTGLTNLSNLDLSENPLTDLTFPIALPKLTVLRVENGALTNLALPAGLTELTTLRLGFNHLSGLVLPADMTKLSILSVFQNLLTNLDLPPSLTNLSLLSLDGNQLSKFHLPPGLTKLGVLTLSANQLTDFTLPAGLTNLTTLNLSQNQLTNVVLPSDLSHLTTLNLAANQLTTFNVPSGLTSLLGLFLTQNQLTNITLPPDLTQIIGFGYLLNPLVSVVLSEQQATKLAQDVAFLESEGVSVFTYPLEIRLLRPRLLTGAFQIGITGPPGDYVVLGSTNLLDWTQVGIASNPLGTVSFVDTNAHLFPQRYYRALTAPANMVFVPPSTFTMGSPTNEQDRSINEGPQTVVTLTRGYWIGKYEVTQGEYLSVMGTNPADFQGDLSRPMENMGWEDATNYCGKLTQREIAAGHIPAGSRYRLPTEAEWECAARAGTTTRFSYGDDPGNTILTNYAWFLNLSSPDLITHPVGEKLPNPWGMYDTYGNVWEWCQDWYGDLPGGAVTDPTGPASNPLGFKVMRGGAYDYGENTCRSASRLFQNHNDSDLGFRVVLVIGEQ